MQGTREREREREDKTEGILLERPYGKTVFTQFLLHHTALPVIVRVSFIFCLNVKYRDMQRNTKPEDYRLAQGIIDLGLMDYFSLQNRYEISVWAIPCKDSCIAKQAATTLQHLTFT